jgi:two-component system sensor histidine kinase/response regulator
MQSPYAGIRTILVDDNVNNLTLLKRIIINFELDTVDATDGYQALNLLDQQPFDLVLLDIMMPKLNGFETLKHIRERWNMQELPVILVSALDSERDVVAGLELGANDYVTKPYSLQLVKTRISNQLRLIQHKREQAAMLEAVTEANNMKSRLMRIASHDLKNPLNNVNMVLGLFENLTEEEQRFLAIADRSVEVMYEIIRDFLDADILRDEDMKMNLEALAVKGIVGEVVDLFAYAIDQKNLQVFVELADEPIMADRHRFTQVMTNLISNAIKYTAPSTTISIVGSVSDNLYELHVMDEGKGINPDEAHLLFQPFGQLSNKPTGGEHSTGLGLWIVKQMIEAQHGTVGINLDAPKGADFWVKFPLVSTPGEQQR